MRTVFVAARTVAALCALLGAIGCGRGESEPEALVASLGLEDRSTYADAVPPEFQVRIGPRSSVNAARREAGESPIASEAITLVDADGDRMFFPVPSEIRAFADRGAFEAFLDDSFGTDENLGGPGGSYSVHGVPRFRDATTGILYRVTDPLLAFTAGAHGVVRIAEERVCFDPDGECDSDYASYLSPEGSLTTAPAVVEYRGSNGVVMKWTSFFNKSEFPFWARHGSNVGLNVAALPNTTMRTGGFLVGCTPGYLGCPYWYNYPLVEVSNSGQQSAEAAHWTAWADGSNYIWIAQAVCGTGTGYDVDTGLQRRQTSNGPSWAMRTSCPE